MEQIRARIREARRRLHRGANPRAGGGEARSFSIRAACDPTCWISSEKRCRPTSRRSCRTTASSRTRCSSRTAASSGSSESCFTRCSSCFCSIRTRSFARCIQAQLNTMYAGGGAAGVVAPRDGSAVLRADPQPGPGADAERDRGQEPEDARRIALQPARVQRTPGARARERRCVQTLGRGAPAAAIATASGRVTARCTDDATTANAIAAAAAAARRRTAGRTRSAQPSTSATTRPARGRPGRRTVWRAWRGAAAGRQRHGRIDGSWCGDVRLRGPRSDGRFGATGWNRSRRRR